MFKEEDFTPRNVAKYIAAGIVSTKTNQFVRDTVDDHTRFDGDNFVVKIGAGLVAWGVTSRVKPYTDAAIDRTADYIVAKREERKQAAQDTPKPKSE